MLSSILCPSVYKRVYARIVRVKIVDLVFRS